MLGRVSVSLRWTASRIRLRTSNGRWSGPTERDEVSYQAIPASTPASRRLTSLSRRLRHRRSGASTGGAPGLRARSCSNRATKLTCPNCATMSSRASRSSAEHFGEIDVAYAARKRALALDPAQFHGDAFCIDHFAKVEGAVGGALRTVPCFPSPREAGSVGSNEAAAWLVGHDLPRGSVAFCWTDVVRLYAVLDRFVKYLYARQTMGRPQENSTWTRPSRPCAKNFGATATRDVGRQASRGHKTSERGAASTPPSALRRTSGLVPPRSSMSTPTARVATMRDLAPRFAQGDRGAASDALRAAPRPRGCFLANCTAELSPARTPTSLLSPARRLARSRTSSPRRFSGR